MLFSQHFVPTLATLHFLLKLFAFVDGHRFHRLFVNETVMIDAVRIGGRKTRDLILLRGIDNELGQLAFALVEKKVFLSFIDLFLQIAIDGTEDGCRGR